MSAYRYNIFQFQSYKVFEKCSTGDYGAPYYNNETTPARIEFELNQNVDKIVIQGFSSLSFSIWNVAWILIELK